MCLYALGITETCKCKHQALESKQISKILLLASSLYAFNVPTSGVEDTKSHILIVTHFYNYFFKFYFPFDLKS